MKRSMAALVIGNAGYPSGNNLANPLNDASDLGEKLRGYGFEVLVALDCSVQEMEGQLKAFRGLLETHEVGLFFFAGHGMQIEGSNYLIALNTDMDSEIDAKHSSLSLDKVVDVMAKSQASTKIIILDACRSNPWERVWHRGRGTRGLASVYAPKGTIIGFATSPGEVASDGIGRNGTYTEALLQHIDTPDCSIETMFKRVWNTVAAATSGKQTSWEHTSLSGEFYFNMSLGNLIEEYDGTALADSLFVIDPTKTSHKVIQGLKTYNWYKQNPAIDLLTAESVNGMGKDNLFVVGRNIYQAACGNSGYAGNFIDNFINITHGFRPSKRKCILDGMLFEIFFNSMGQMRKTIKGRYFDEVFDLQRYSQLQDSFDFIAETLTVAGGDFYAVPGKGHDVAVTVSTRKKVSGTFVEAIYIGGANILRLRADTSESSEVIEEYTEVDPEALEQQLAEELIVPSRFLKVTYTPGAAAKEDCLYIPRGWIVRK